jgi:UDP-N-acetyl-D-mannosaminuronic acid transferase (WecB/TagA/CpsF family)
MGLDVAAVSERDTINYVLDRLARRRGGWMETVNLDILRQWRGSADVRDLLAAADLVVADGSRSCGQANFKARPSLSASQVLR